MIIYNRTTPSDRDRLRHYVRPHSNYLFVWLVVFSSPFSVACKMANGIQLPRVPNKESSDLRAASWSARARPTRQAPEPAPGSCQRGCSSGSPGARLCGVRTWQVILYSAKDKHSLQI